MGQTVGTGGHVSTLPRPCWVMGFLQIRRIFGGRGGMEDGLAATNLHRKASAANCLYISGFGWLRPQNPNVAPPLDPAGDFRPSEPPVLTLTSEPGYATGDKTLRTRFLAIWRRLLGTEKPQDVT